MECQPIHHIEHGLWHVLAVMASTPELDPWACQPGIGMGLPKSTSGVPEVYLCALQRGLHKGVEGVDLVLVHKVVERDGET